MPWVKVNVATCAVQFVYLAIHFAFNYKDAYSCILLSVLALGMVFHLVLAVNYDRPNDVFGYLALSFMFDTFLMYGLIFH